MTVYKCISCGNTKESEKECCCSECGYKMFLVTLERREIFKNEIQKFLRELMLNKIEEHHLTYYREISKNEKISKTEDDERFPNFEKNQNYVCSADKTERFVERLNLTLEQIEKHISSPFYMQYITDFTSLYQTLEEHGNVLKKVLLELGEKTETEVIEFPKTILDYSEIPNDDLLFAAKSLITAIRELNIKIYKFIKQNNMYGTGYQKKFNFKLKTENDADFMAEITKAKENILNVLETKYRVDILSDGKKELHEMLGVLWKSIAVVTQVPIFTKTYCYLYGDTKLTENDFKNRLIADIHTQYSNVFKTFLAPQSFDNKTDDELFDLYNKMIEFDLFGFMGVNKSELSLCGEYEKKLENLIGLSCVKENIQKIKAYAISNRESERLNLHMCFYGNPGTGKTEVARIIAGILYENKILPTKKVVEVSRKDLIGQYVGETPQKTAQKINEAMGGILFVDEAYSLISTGSGFDYGNEAISTLIKAMEDYRGKFCVILAGYKNQMKTLISSNPGFKSRIQFELEFPDYARDELRDILGLMLKKKQYTISEDAREKMLDIAEIKRREPNFANAREIRNILDGVIMCQNLRSIGTEDKELGMVDVKKYVKDSKINIPMEMNTSKTLTAEEELDNLVGLVSVKRMVKKIKAFAKKNRNAPEFNLHMCFYGNPGTGKTEVARIMSSILYNIGVLPEAKIIETDSHGLMGKLVGETAPKTQAKISDAMGGVLFIDEAYGLVNSDSMENNGYGDEAVEVLLKNMEDQRGEFCVILAGYKQEMQVMLNFNAGFKSRVQFILDFPDYTCEELGEIALRMLDKRKYTIASDAMELLLDVTEYYRKKDNFANARTVRNILDQVIMNQNLRTEDSEKDDREILKSDVEDYITDENIDLKNPTTKIGFV